MKWWVIELHNYIMNDNSEAHNLSQILRLLHLAPVTFRPGLPYCTIVLLRHSNMIPRGGRKQIYNLGHYTFSWLCLNDVRGSSSKCLFAKPTSRISVLTSESILQLKKDALNSKIKYGPRSANHFSANTSLDLKGMTDS